MAVRAIVDPQPEPGHAVLRLAGLEAAPEGLALSIQRQQGPDSHLGDDGWRRTETWLQPDSVERRGEEFAFHLGPEVCDRLAGGARALEAAAGAPFTALATIDEVHPDRDDR